jgi:hypothetical protein
MTARRPGKSLTERFGELLEPEPMEPAMASACPAVNERPRDLAQFQAALRAADGDQCDEIDACQAASGMTLWCPDTERWFFVDRVETDEATHTIYGNAPRKTTIFIAHPPPGTDRWWLVDADRPVVQRIAK